jgi:hypothetical protein
MAGFDPNRKLKVAWSLPIGASQMAPNPFASFTVVVSGLAIVGLNETRLALG